MVISHPPYILKVKTEYKYVRMVKSKSFFDSEARFGAEELNSLCHSFYIHFFRVPHFYSPLFYEHFAVPVWFVWERYKGQHYKVYSM